MTLTAADVRKTLAQYRNEMELAGIDQTRRDMVAMPKDIIGPLLIALLVDEDSDIRWDAADLLLDINPHIYLKDVLRLHDDPDINIRSGICYRIAEKAPFHIAVDPLCQVLIHHTDSNTRFWAAIALAAIGDVGNRRAVDALLQALTDDGLNYESVPVSPAAKYALSAYPYR